MKMEYFRDGVPLIDDAHYTLDPFEIPLIYDVWKDKYAWGDEQAPEDMFERVVDAIYAKEHLLGIEPHVTQFHRNEAYRILAAGLFVPGGRILAGAGTSKRVTLMNCYVNETIEDSMEGIHRCIGNVMMTLQQGGGIGTDFSTLRPKRAVLRRTGAGAEASGPLPFMDQWDATSKTIKSAGDRRGAMMGTLSDTHPDLPEFIVAKHERGKWEQFNVSVLISDAFMDAVKRNAKWLLYFNVPPAYERSDELVPLDFVDSNGEKQYIYSIWNARDLWDLILKNTYEYSEPGVIFIDRVNALNNLRYCETIRCTNPCGEQPLPPNGTCNLGAINLARIVKNPFTTNAEIDLPLLRWVVREAVRFLDNVIDITEYPLEAQKAEELSKRRLGLGITGLADCLAQLQITYGDNVDARNAVHNIMYNIAREAYETSVFLAQERGSFPLFDKEEFLEGDIPLKLTAELKNMIEEIGIRNGLLLTVAPTGTTSMIVGNVSSGLECTFLHEASRRVYGKDDVWKEYGVVPAYGYRLYQQVHGKCAVEDLPEYMVTSEDLSIGDHLAIQAACQNWIDASVSKTINLPADIDFETFKDVYINAYDLGCKGCTTYRPSDVRGSVLAAPKRGGENSNTDKALEEPVPVEDIRNRPAKLAGATYKIKWPSWSSAIYVTINHDQDNQPFEVFIQSKDARHQEWITALTIMISAHMRTTRNIQFIPEELQQIQSTHDSAWVDGKFYGSLVQRIGAVIEEHLISMGGILEEVEVKNTPSKFLNELCPNCGSPTMIKEEGCFKCTSCAFTKCG